MFKKPDMDKPFDEITDKEWKKYNQWRRSINILVATIFLAAIALGIICAFLTPSSWRWFLKIPIGVATSCTVLWLAAIIHDNIQYNDRKKEQARKKQLMIKKKQLLEEEKIFAPKNAPNYLKVLNAKPSNDKVGQIFITSINKPMPGAKPSEDKGQKPDDKL